MKLVEIKDIRPGQVWINDQTGLIHTVDNLGNLSNANKTETTKIRDEYLKSAKCWLIGKIGITHRIEGNRLVEIPREDLVVDDVVEYLDFDGFKVTAVIASLITGMTREDSQYGFITNDGNFDESSLFEKEEIGEDSGTFTYTPKKIGILGVTHEFVNEREVMDD